MSVKVVAFAVALAAVFITAQDAIAGGRGDEVVVVYNSKLAESKEVADHYAAARGVPAAQVMGFALPTIEAISRPEYTEHLEKPLLAALKKKSLFVTGPTD